MKVTEPAKGELGTVVSGLRVQDVDAETAAELRQLVYRHKLVVLEGQEVERAEYVAFARVMGRPQVYFQSNYHHPEHPEIFVSSNVPENGRKVGVARTGRFWHSDYQFFAEPLSITTVMPVVLPEGPRETLFVDMARAWSELPGELRDFARRHWAYHDASWFYKIRPEDVDRPVLELVRAFREEAPGAVHPLVIRHPVLDYEALYLSEGFTTSIVGLSAEEGRRRLQELLGAVFRPEVVHHQPWRSGDLLMWDNRGVAHRGGETRADQPSINYRIGIYDDLPFYRPTGPAPAPVLPPTVPQSMSR